MRTQGFRSGINKIYYFPRKKVAISASSGAVGSPIKLNYGAIKRNCTKDACLECGAIPKLLKI